MVYVEVAGKVAVLLLGLGGLIGTAHVTRRPAPRLQRVAATTLALAFTGGCAYGLVVI